MAENMQYSRNRNMQIDDIPEVPGEDYVEVIDAVGKALGLHITEADFETVHRTNTRN